jgi:hypothetical protein
MKRLIDDPIAAMDLILVDPASDEIERATLPGMAEPGAFWAWMARRRANLPRRRNRKSVPTRTAPAKTVPVTTVPAPGNEKLRSTARRKRPPRERCGRLREASMRRASSTSSPSPLTTETGTISAPARLVCAIGVDAGQRSDQRGFTVIYGRRCRRSCEGRLCAI